jgi:hypothetical protein
MGIEQLWVILDEKKCGQCISLNRLRSVIKIGTDRCRIAFDARLVFHKYFSSYWKIIVESGRFSYERIYSECIRKIKDFCKTLTNEGIDQLWCLDGNRTDDKLATSRRILAGEPRLIELATIHKRCTQAITSSDESLMDTEAHALLPYAFLKEYWPLCDKNAEEATTENPILDQIDTLKKLLAKCPVIPRDFADVMERELTKQGCEFLHVPEISEGEKVCVYAVQSGYCQAVFTNDTDVLPMGVRYVVKEVKDGIARVYSYSQALRNLEMTHEQFLSLCILLGNDFNNGVEGMAKVKCLSAVMKEDFNLYDFDISRCGCLRVNACINAFSLNTREFEIVCAAIERLK